MGLLLLGSAVAHASPAAPGERTFTQPDGTMITLTAWGDEFLSGYETLDGHTVLRTSEDAFFEYAERGADGRLVASGHRVGRDEPTAAPGLRPTLAAAEEERLAAGAPIYSTATATAPAWAGSDTDLLFLVAEFSDVGCTYTDSNFQAILGGTAATGPGNMADYYDEISNGNLALDITVEGGTNGCYTLPSSRATYNSGSKDHFDLMNELVDLADGDVDFSQYDNDGDGTIDALGIIYAGGGTHDGCANDNGASGAADDNLWPKSRSQSYATDDGVSTGNFIINSELTYNAGSYPGVGNCTVAQSIGLFVHEFGHSLGLPDLYDSDGSSSGVSSWSTMGSQYLSTVVLADTPPHFDPWSKWRLDWVSPDDKTTFVGNGPIDHVEDDNYVIQMLDNPNGAEEGGTGEYFLVENRQLVGFDSQLTGCGLVVWHIDEAKTNNTKEAGTAADHFLVAVEQADGNFDLEANNGADAGDPFPGTSTNRAFTGTSTPSSNLYDGTPSGVHITDISDCGAVMTANFGQPNADVSISKFDSPDPVVAGEQLTYTVVVDNDGPGTAPNVVVTDVLPDGVSMAANTDSCTDDGSGTLTCELGQLLSGESRTFQIVVDVDADAVADDPDGTIAITNEVTVASDITDGNLSNNTASASTIVTEEADLALTKVCKPDEGVPADAGTEAFCTISVTNLGPSVARDAVVEELLTSSISFSVTSTTSGCSDVAATDGRLVTCDLGDIAPGETERATVYFTSDEDGPVNDVATVSSPTPDPVGTNNFDEGAVVFRRVADLSVTKGDSPDPVIAGEQLTYTITVSNDGPSTASNVVVSDHLDGDVSVISVSGSDGASCQAGVPGDSSRPSTCSFGNVLSGASRTMTIVVLVEEAATGQLENDVAVTSDTFDPDTDDNTDTETTQVDTAADVSITKTDEPDPVVAGEQLSYTLTIENTGPSVARDVTVEDQLPDGVSVDSIDVLPTGSASCTVVASGDIVRCDVGDLAVGASIDIVVHLLVDASVADGTVLTNTATVESSNDPDASNNTATTETTVEAEADLAIAKDVNFETGNSSTTIIYSIDVTNLGSSDAQDVVVIDDLPSVTTKGGKQKVDFVFATDGCTYDEASHTVTCDAGTLAAGDTVSFEIHIQVKGSVGELINTATVSSSTSDPNVDNDTVEKTVLVEGGSDRPGGPGGGRGRPA